MFCKTAQLEQPLSVKISIVESR